MSRRVDAGLLEELKHYGAVGAEKCIQCGNCTAICSLTEEGERFPRHMIRMAQLGMKEELLGSKELWLCYNCGDCSETCPQGAEPANLMAAARCYAISHYAPFKLGTLFCRYPIWGALIAILSTIFFSLFIYSERATIATDTLRLFDFIPRDFIHTAGLIVLVLVGLISLATIASMIVHIARVNNLSIRHFIIRGQENWLKALWDAVVVQSFLQKRYREDCNSTERKEPWLIRKWFVHAATMWGFLGLLAATALNFLLDIADIKATGTMVPIWYPTRLIGTLSGLLFIYGVTVLLLKRWRSVDKAHGNSRPSDYIFLALLWLSGLTGFVIEIALYLPGAPLWGYWTFIFHVAVSITLLLLLPFTKFAHAIYRTVALYIHALKPALVTEITPANAE